MMHVVIQELQQAFLQLRRAPRFSAVVLGLLAAGIGSTIAVFSLFHSLVLRPLPFPDAGRLVGIQSINVAKGIVQTSVSVADARDFAAQARSYTALGALRPNFAAYTRPGEAPVRLVTALVTPGLLDALAVQPVLGRTFAADDFSFTAARSVILSHLAWQRHFGGAPTVLGQSMILDDETYTIIGIMPESFREPAFVDAWLPFPNESPEYFVRDSRFWTLIGRLAPGVSAQQAQAEMSALSADLAREYPDSNRDWSAAVVGLHELRTRELRPALLLLLGAVGLVLLIACLNLANLLLARALSRLPELAVRLALGATPRQLARRVFLECLLLAAGGAVAGSVAAWWLVPRVAQQIPPGIVPRAHEAAVQPLALLTAAGLALVCAATCAALPAWQVRRSNVDALLRQGATRSASSGITRWQAWLVVAQVAFTVTVLAGALLLMKSLQRLQKAPLGFDPEQIITLRLSPPPSRYERTTDLARYYQDLIEAVERVPGVRGTAVNASTPLGGISLTYPTWLGGELRDATAAREAVYAPISEGYFALVGQPMRRGRTFTAHDGPGGAPVAIVNETYARRAFPDGQALGQRVLLLPWMGETYREIVGIVADTLQEDLAAPPLPQVYVPQRQMPWFFSTLLIKLERPGILPAVQAALREVDPTLPFAPTRWSDDIAQTATQPRLYARLFGTFAAIAVALSAFGIYASLRFTLHQRQREVGIRVALGATPEAIGLWVLGRCGRWVGAGMALGLGGAIAIALALRQQLFGVSALDPTTFLLLPALVAFVAAAAALPTAWRAARLPPLRAAD